MTFRRALIPLVVLFALFPSLAVREVEAISFGSPFLFPDLQGGTAPGAPQGVFLDLGVTAIVDTNGVSSASAAPSQAGLNSIPLFLISGGSFTGFWSNEPLLPAGIQAGTFYTITATNGLSQTSSITTPSFVPLPSDLTLAQNVSFGVVGPNTEITWNRVFVGGQEVSAYQIRGIDSSGVTVFNTQISPHAFTPTQMNFILSGTPAFATITVDAVVQNANNTIITGRSRDFVSFPFSGVSGGSIQGFPVLPNVISQPGKFVFTNVSGGRWFDPGNAFGFHYVMLNGSLFTGIAGFPTGFANKFTVSANGTVLGMFGPGDQLTFPGGGVSDFLLTGIDPLADPNNPSGFPLELLFNTQSANFEMDALVTPEPTTLLLWGTSMAGLGLASRWRRRRQN
jgi:hypothetical protein